MYIIIKTQTEIFKTITYPGIAIDKYEISNYGKVRNKETGKILKSFSDKKNHLRLKLISDYKSSINIFVHRLVAWEFVDGYDECEERTVVNHKDSNPLNNYFENLEWVTIKENNHHGIKHGHIRFGASGEDNFSNKYDLKTVKEICMYLEKGFSQMKIMKIYGYDKRKHNNSLYSLIDGIKRKKIWKDVSKNYDI